MSTPMFGSRHLRNCLRHVAVVAKDLALYKLRIPPHLRPRPEIVRNLCLRINVIDLEALY